MNDIKLFDVVKVVGILNTVLVGQIAVVMGFHTPEYPIIVFRDTPEGYNPAIVLSIYCLEKVQ